VVGSVEVGNPLPNETARQWLPWLKAVRDSYRAGRAPLWYRGAYSGTPLLGNGQSAPFSPFLLATLFVPLPEQMVAMAGLKVFVALLFGYLLLRREGVSAAAAVLGSTIFALSLFQVVFLYFSSTAVTALLPALVYAIATVLERPGRGSALLLGVVTASMLAAGHPESVLHCALAGGVFLLVERAAPAGRVHWRFAGPAMAAAIGWGLLLAAPAWAPLFEQVPYSARMARVEEREPARDARGFPVAGAALLVNPDHFGHPARGTWRWRFNYAEASPVYVGLLPLALIGVAVASRRAARRDRLIFAAAVVFLLVALGWTPVGRAANSVPPLAWAANGRLRFVVCLFLAMLTARTLSRFRASDLPLAALGTVAVSLAFVASEWGSPDPHRYLMGVAALGGFWAACAVRFRGGLRAISIAALTTPLVAAELVIAATVFHPVSDRGLYAPRLPIVDALRRHAPTREPFRVTGAVWALTPDLATHYGLEDIRGNDPMSNRSYVAFLDMLGYRPGGTGELRLIRSFPQPALDFLNVRYVFTDPKRRLRPPLRLLYSGRDGKLYENPGALPRFFAPTTWQGVAADSVWTRLAQVDDYRRLALVDGEPSPVALANGRVLALAVTDDGFGTFELDVTAAEESLIASSVPKVPGWRLELDSRSTALETVNGAFVGFFVPAGRSRITLRYRPWTFDLGLAGCGVAVLLAMAATLGRSARPGDHDLLEGPEGLRGRGSNQRQQA
jgi:hypothetical protein